MNTVAHVSARVATAADITPEWIAAVGSVLRRDGQAFRAGAHAAVIEVQSINTGAWMPLNLPTNGALFDSIQTRDHTLACIEHETASGDLARDIAATQRNQ